ncbi:MAG: hypothetical protein CVU42_15160 [Chloroflexi bacterium HGW-Chloroflexi-4]|jgi:dsDNA-specific endonuclease/ATPase MutS2|nr:MAG: hypothetical protein CVU42_15160 [Chloroflexi bacterium HGW-Chloroflexi-4]
MEKNELHDLLNQLHQEIKKTKEVDDKGLALLRDLEADIAALLDRSDETFEPVKSSVFKNMSDTIVHFEVTHPTLTDQVTKISDILSGAGI